MTVLECTAKLHMGKLLIMLYVLFHHGEFVDSRKQAFLGRDEKCAFSPTVDMRGHFLSNKESRATFMFVDMSESSSVSFIVVHVHI